MPNQLDDRLVGIGIKGGPTLHAVFPPLPTLPSEVDLRQTVEQESINGRMECGDAWIMVLTATDEPHLEVAVDQFRGNAVREVGKPYRFRFLDDRFPLFAV